MTQLDNLFIGFGSSVSTSLIEHPVTCSGKILTWLIGGIPIGTSGNQFTLNLFRPLDSSVSLVSRATIGLGDIAATDSPNVYRISNPDASFTIQNGDFLTITYDRTQDTSQFNISHINLEGSSILKNAIFNRLFTANFPLISLQMAGESL